MLWKTSAFGTQRTWLDLLSARLGRERRWAAARASTGSGRWPTDQIRWRPPCLAPCNPCCPIFCTPVSRLRRSGEQGAILEHIDVDHAPDAVSFGQEHGHVDAASAAHDLLRCHEPERVQLDVLGHSSDQNNPRLWVRERPGIMLAAERALTGPDNLILGRPISLKFDLDRPAVATTLVLHSVSPNLAVGERRRRP
jgi:hypothetical protein